VGIDTPKRGLALFHPLGAKEGWSFAESGIFIMSQNSAILRHNRGIVRYVVKCYIFYDVNPLLGRLANASLGTLPEDFVFQERRVTKWTRNSSLSFFENLVFQGGRVTKWAYFCFFFSHNILSSYDIKIFPAAIIIF